MLNNYLSYCPLYWKL